MNTLVTVSPPKEPNEHKLSWANLSLGKLGLLVDNLKRRQENMAEKVIEVMGKETGFF